MIGRLIATALGNGFVEEAIQKGCNQMEFGNDEAALE
jgi:hypothetical protein